MSKGFAFVGLKATSAIAERLCNSMGIQRPAHSIHVPVWVISRDETGAWVRLGSSPRAEDLPVFISSSDIQSIHIGEE